MKTFVYKNTNVKNMPESRIKCSINFNNLSGIARVSEVFRLNSFKNVIAEITLDDNITKEEVDALAIILEKTSETIILHVPKSTDISKAKSLLITVGALTLVKAMMAIQSGMKVGDLFSE